ncbi:MAG: DEAD/DEAH box helicase [Bdellovibrionales bacterium]|nr:DEAD/DEAH box helicase [Bdellovibrionales bacterium]
MSFSNFALTPNLFKALEDMKFTTPTPVQMEVIPLILNGKDIIASSQTGSGKTGAFCIPLIANLENNPDEAALILTPTRELAEQIFHVAIKLTQHMKGVKSALLIGGTPIHKQVSHLRNRPRIIIATPGRANDLVERKALDLSNVKYLVLDETDRMLEMGFEIQIKGLIQLTAKDRQNLLFSAKNPKKNEALSHKYLNDPIRVKIDMLSKPSEALVQDVAMVKEVLKFDFLLNEINTRTGTMIIFTKTKRGADKLSDKLYEKEIRSRALHGDLSQEKRKRITQQFRSKQFEILIATDVAARGLDIPHVEHVINYDVPLHPQEYMHRIGRTARAGAKGHALTIVAPQDEDLWANIEHYLSSDGTSSYDVDPKRNKKSSGRGRGRKRKSHFDRKREASSKDREFKRGKSDRFKNKGKGRSFSSERSESDERPSRKPKRDRNERSFGSDRPRKRKDSDRNERSFGSDRSRKRKDSDRNERSFGGDRSGRRKNSTSKKKSSFTVRDGSSNKGRGKKGGFSKSKSKTPTPF